MQYEIDRADSKCQARRAISGQAQSSKEGQFGNNAEGTAFARGAVVQSPFQDFGA